jgi:hypothetical protein
VAKKRRAATEFLFYSFLVYMLENCHVLARR